MNLGFHQSRTFLPGRSHANCTEFLFESGTAAEWCRIHPLSSSFAQNPPSGQGCPGKSWQLSGTEKVVESKFAFPPLASTLHCIVYEWLSFYNTFSKTALRIANDSLSWVVILSVWLTRLKRPLQVRKRTQKTLAKMARQTAHRGRGTKHMIVVDFNYYFPNKLKKGIPNSMQTLILYEITIIVSDSL